MKANKELRWTIKNAKRQWAHDFLDHATADNLWAAARWRRGRSNSRIPPLISANGTLTEDPAGQAATLGLRFFDASPPPVDPSQPDDPPPRPVREWPPIINDEIKVALTGTSNGSAPGRSGINYKLLKWAFEASPPRFTSLFNAALSLGHHPWKDAKVVVLPKPGKPDYRMPKAYRPISLLECCGKLLEKVIATRVLAEVNEHDLIPPNQFSSRDYHCAADAALIVAHNAQACITSRHVGALILFDIQGFFDNVNVERAARVFQDLGFPPQFCTWIRSFLTGRHIFLSFNGFTADSISIDFGTPQGSPLSPILTAIYTSPLLKYINRTWRHRSLNLFVDDGSIFMTGPTYCTAITAAAAGLEDILGWLKRNGLRADPDKTELMIFKHRHSPHFGSPISSIVIRDPFHGEYVVKASFTLRYLGVFFHHCLRWDPHVTTMECRARSTIRALGILGNSIRGLDFANWRKVYHALILPILTYALPVWFADSGQKGLINRLQVAQNDAICKISGCFHTTPILPLHHLLAIPPIHFTLTKLHDSFNDRLARLPPNVQIRTIPYHNPAACWPAHISFSTSLTRLPFFSVPPISSIVPECLLERMAVASALAVETPVSPTIRTSFRPEHHEPRRLPFYFPTPTSTPPWSHTRFRNLFSLTSNPIVARDSKLLNSQPPPDVFSLFVRPLKDHHPYFVSSFVLYRGEQVVAVKGCIADDQCSSLFRALLAGLMATPLFGKLVIWVSEKSFATSLLNLRKHSCLTASFAFVNFIDSFLAQDKLHQAELRSFSVKWSGLSGRKLNLDRTSDDATHHIMALPPRSTLPPNLKVFDSWKSEYLSNHHTYTSAPWISCEPPEDSKPPPFIQGALSLKQRRILSAAIQLTTRHGFHADYSDKFRPDAGDVTACPCSGPLQPTRYTVEHVIFHCPLHSNHRAAIFSPQPITTQYVFGTYHGGRKLGKFLLATQALLRPLPLRPDPP